MSKLDRRPFLYYRVEVEVEVELGASYVEIAKLAVENFTLFARKTDARDDSVCFITANCQNQRGEEAESRLVRFSPPKPSGAQEKTRMRESFLVAPADCACV